MSRAVHGVRAALRFVPFSFWFVGRMAVANWQVARDLVTPGIHTTPGVAAVPLRCRTRFELTLLSNLITLTPGTVTIEVDRHGHVLYVLDIYGPPTADEMRVQVQQTETRMLRMLRGVEPPPAPTGVRWEWSGRPEAPVPVVGTGGTPAQGRAAAGTDDARSEGRARP
ncbi:MAG: Na+/H+ antiporter subunit E [Actinotalea sp.]|nr:Na+/H+ antiporter subunit E [Actinotalea sp.]